MMTIAGSNSSTGMVSRATARRAIARRRGALSARTAPAPHSAPRSGSR